MTKGSKDKISIRVPDQYILIPSDNIWIDNTVAIQLYNGAHGAICYLKQLKL